MTTIGPPTPESVNAAIASLRRTIGTAAVNAIVLARPSVEQVGFHRELLALGVERNVVLIEQKLVDATTPGGVLDPVRLGADAVWAALISTLLEAEPDNAAKFAKGFFGRLSSLSWEYERSVSVVVFAVSAYVTALVEGHIGRSASHFRWLRMGDAFTDEDEDGVGILCYLRACHLLVGQGTDSG